MQTAYYESRPANGRLVAYAGMIMSEWFVSKSGKTHGPFSASQLKQLAAETKIGPETEVRLGTDGTWVTAKTVKGLFAAQAVTTAAVVPTAAAGGCGDGRSGSGTY